MEACPGSAPVTAAIDLEAVNRRFGDVAAVDDVDLSVAPGELVAFLGPSGSGKTTLLRIVAGLEAADSGRILLDGHDATDLGPAQRRIGFVFQSYALFGHMTVFENIAFGLRVRPRAERPGEAEIRRRVRELLELVQLDGLANRRPDEVSGGQRQRIALARALAVDPRVLLLDEPFGALDAQVRRDLRRWLRSFHDQVQVTTLFVTHDQEEALELADRVVVLRRRRIEQVGTPEELVETPSSRFVASFLGATNELQGTVQSGRARFHGMSCEAPGFLDGAPVVGCVRPFDFQVVASGGLSVRVRRVVRVVGTRRVELEGPGGERLEVDLPVDALAPAFEPGAFLQVQPRRLQVFAADQR